MERPQSDRLLRAYLGEAFENGCVWQDAAVSVAAPCDFGTLAIDRHEEQPQTSPFSGLAVVLGRAKVRGNKKDATIFVLTCVLSFQFTFLKLCPVPCFC